MFFVLSGFLITKNLLNEQSRHGKINLKKFYLRRVLRLFPAQLALIVFLYFTHSIILQTREATETLHAIPIALFYMSDFAIAFFDNYPLGALKHTWSLAVEEQFYLLWPPLLILMARKLNPKTTFIALIAAIAAIAIIRATIWVTTENIIRLYYSIDTRSDALLIGCVLGVFLYSNIEPSLTLNFNTRIAGKFLLIFIGFCLAFTDYSSASMYLGGFTAFAAATALIIGREFNNNSSQLKKILAHPAFTFTGRISYGIYLWHYPIFKAVHSIDIALGLQLLIAVLVTFLAAILSHKLIEQPFLRLKSRLR
jgi:peptidoglycan/LPS O-acetylase OafA/YrhL